MKFGVHAFLWTATFDESNLDLFPMVKQWGFDGLEVPLFDPRTFPSAGIRRTLEAHAMGCTVSAVMVDGLSLISEDADVRRRARAHLADAIKAVAEAAPAYWRGRFIRP
jgi:D-psicose/D-tagatose/L-ribulose 3-epimerase